MSPSVKMLMGSVLASIRLLTTCFTPHSFIWLTQQRQLYFVSYGRTQGRQFSFQELHWQGHWLLLIFSVSQPDQGTHSQCRQARLCNDWPSTTKHRRCAEDKPDHDSESKDSSKSAPFLFGSGFKKEAKERSEAFTCLKRNSMLLRKR